MNKFEEFCKEVEQVRGASVYGEINDSPYVELAIVSDYYISQIYRLISKYNYTVIAANECEGSDYPSYCIWFE